MLQKKGFTLIEIGIVIFIIGILIAAFIPNFTQRINDTAIAKMMITNSYKVAETVKIIADSCGKPG